VRLKALKEIEKDKARVAKAYNKKVKSKSFQVRELVWKTRLPIGSKSIQWEVLEKVFSKCLARSLSDLQTIADTCITLRAKMDNVYITLSY
jgi:hypothetical protein